MENVKFLDDRLAGILERNIKAVISSSINVNNVPIAAYTGKIGAIASELQSHGEQMQSEEDAYKIDLTREYDEPHFSLSFDGVGTMPTGDIQAIKAKSKSGKSFLCSVFIASLLGCSSFGFTSTIKNPKVIYFDTEQNQRNTARLAIRVHKMLGWSINVNHDDFLAYNLRTMNTSERLPFIDRIIKTKKPTSVFIDGVADLIENFNDIIQSSSLINNMMQLSAGNDCSITCVLHTNKAKDDNGMKGHLGTMLLQKSSDVFETKRDNGIFSVTETDCRNLPINDFSFEIDRDGIPQRAATIKENKELEALESIKETLAECFSTDNVLCYTDLVNRYSECAAVSEITAKRKIQKAKKDGLLQVIPNRGYSMVS